MSCLISDKVYHLVQGGIVTAAIDAGDSTAGEATGVLNNGVVVSSGAVSQGKKPSGADDLTFGSVTLVTAAEYVNDRSVGTAEAVQFTVTAAAAQAVGRYVVEAVLTLDNSDTPAYGVQIQVEAFPS